MSTLIAEFILHTKAPEIRRGPFGGVATYTNGRGLFPCSSGSDCSIEVAGGGTSSEKCFLEVRDDNILIRGIYMLCFACSLKHKCCR